jgi:phage tail-like protein
MIPQVAFFFRIKFPEEPASTDTSFQEISGISSEKNTEQIEEGGENMFVHTVPKGSKHGNLVLKRGIANKLSNLTRWCKETIEGDLENAITPKTIQVELLNAKGEAAFVWTINNAYPVKWSIDTLNSTKNEIVIESIEFAYSYSTREK